MLEIGTILTKLVLVEYKSIASKGSTRVVESAIPMSSNSIHNCNFFQRLVVVQVMENL